MREHHLKHVARWVVGVALTGAWLSLPSAAPAAVQVVYPSSNALSGLAPGPDGNFYGTSRYGGTHDLGSVFRVTPAGVYQVIHSFTGLTDGFNPRADLVLGPDGQLYGTCQYGAPGGAGSVFKISTSGNFTTLHSFIKGSDGAEPIGGLAEAGGVLLGTASCGGANGFGTVFQVTTGGVFRVLHGFTGSDGNSPAAALTVVTDGLLMGTTRYGGAGDVGTVFSMSTSGVFASLFSFSGTNGAYPATSLVLGRDNILYGTTAYGGTGGFGSVYSITTNGTLNPIHNLAVEHSGANPIGGLVLGADGNLYGSAYHGGAHGFGSLFQLSPFGGFYSLHDFTGNEDGLNPFTTLLSTDANCLLGATFSGGSAGGGILYELVLLHFDNARLLPGLLATYEGAGGEPNGFYTILSATNLAIPRTNWTLAGIGQFDGAGRFIFTNAVSAVPSARFLSIRQP